MNALLLVLSASAAPLTPAGPDPARPEPPAATTPAGDLVVDARVPVEILIDGLKIAVLHVPGESRFRVVPGHHLLRVYTNGLPTDLELDVVQDREARVLVGRTGVSLAEAPPLRADPFDGPVPVEFRVVGTPGAQVRLEKTRHSVSAGASLTVDLLPGPHPISVRNADGTVIWATGTLEVVEGPVIVQIAEGRMPEVSGSAAFHAGG